MQCHYCYHTKLLSSILHSYRVMILEWLLLVPGLGYGGWWPWIFLPKQQGPHFSLIKKIQGKTGNYSWSWLGYRMCWKESNMCTLGTPQWHSFLIHFLAFSICRCRNCWQQTEGDQALLFSNKWLSPYHLTENFFIVPHCIVLVTYAFTVPFFLLLKFLSFTFFFNQNITANILGPSPGKMYCFHHLSCVKMLYRTCLSTRLANSFISNIEWL